MSVEAPPFPDVPMDGAAPAEPAPTAPVDGADADDVAPAVAEPQPTETLYIQNLNEKIKIAGLCASHSYGMPVFCGTERVPRLASSEAIAEEPVQVVWRGAGRRCT